MQRAEGMSVNLYLDAGEQIAKGAGTATRRIDGVICLGARNIDEPFLNRALGFGTLADATPSLLDRIERFYESIGKPPRVAMATGSVALGAMRLLERRGYAPAGHPVLTYVYDRKRPPSVPAIPDLAIERVGPEHATVYARTSFESFSERGPQFVRIIEALIRSRRRGVHAFLGRIDDEPAATGLLFDVRPVGALGNGSVRRKFRGRGLQRALLAHRIAEGWARGYRLFFSETENPASAHNMETVGWRKLYDEQDWVRPA
jgi:GNAT superfamily N-acetyltransferase